jgi:drug/metabolite transporter (DMT)-like permease
MTSETAELLPLIPARAATMAVVALVAVFGVWKVVGFAKVPKMIVIGSGLFDVGANMTLLAGLRLGSLALVSVSASLFPAVTVVLARVVNHEHLRARQVLGLVMVLVAIAAIALG